MGVDRDERPDVARALITINTHLHVLAGSEAKGHEFLIKILVA